MEKHFDAKDMRNVIDDIEWLFSGYREHSDGLISCYEKYRDNELFQGELAEASKQFIDKRQITQAKTQVAMQQKLLDMYKHALMSFHEKVDKAPDARVDLETLDMVNRDLQDIYADLDEYVRYIEKVVKLLQARYGFLGIFTMPNFQPALDTFTALCGGDNPRSGFIDDLKQKFINFDADECDYADSLNFEQEIDDANNLIQAATNMLEGYSREMPKSVRSQVNNTESHHERIGKSVSKEEIYKVLKERYKFSDEEMELLKDNYSGLLVSLYGASKYSSIDAEKIYRILKNKIAINSYHCSEEGIDFIKGFEAYRRYFYHGGKTIGYGMDVDFYPDVEINYVNKDKKEGISELEATRLLGIVLERNSKAVKDFLVKKNIILSQKQYDVVMSIVYNRGLNECTKEVIIAIGEQDDARVKELLDNLDYNFAIKIEKKSKEEALAWIEENPGFVERRAAEYEIYLQGKRKSNS